MLSKAGTAHSDQRDRCLQHGCLSLSAVNVTVHISAFTKLGVLLLCHDQQAFWRASVNGHRCLQECNVKNCSIKEKIVKKFSMNLKKTRWKFERDMETIQPSTDNSRGVREMQKHVRRNMCVSVSSCFLCCFMRQISCVCLKSSRSRSDNYVRDKGIFLCDKG